jgi:hypothetical protein
MVDHIKKLFPKLADGAFIVTSDRDQAYNCIAWAAGVTHQGWWPTENVDDAFWPADVPRVATLDAFQAAFATLGYSLCSSEEPETGFEKIAIFGEASGRPTHAARQLPNGRWTSKLGKAEDIEHELREVEGEIYGSVVCFMKRLLSQK